MRKIFKITSILSIILAFSLQLNAQDSIRPSIRIEEEDGSPSGRPRILKTTNSTLTDNADGTFSLDILTETAADALYLRLDTTNDPLTNDLDMGGNSLVGNSTAGGTLTLSSTSNVTKGKTIFGSASAYDEANDRLGIGTTSPGSPLDIQGASLLGGNVTIGLGTAATDYTLTFDGETNDGVLTWMEDEDYFLFADDVASDTGKYLASSTASGVVTLGGVGGTNNEDLTFDFETTANQAVIGTSTGVTDINHEQINIISTAKVDTGEDFDVVTEESIGSWTVDAGFSTTTWTVQEAFGDISIDDFVTFTSGANNGETVRVTAIFAGLKAITNCTPALSNTPSNGDTFDVVRKNYALPTGFTLIQEVTAFGGQGGTDITNLTINEDIVPSTLPDGALEFGKYCIIGKDFGNGNRGKVMVLTNAEDAAKDILTFYAGQGINDVSSNEAFDLCNVEDVRIMKTWNLKVSGAMDFGVNQANFGTVSASKLIGTTQVVGAEYLNVQNNLDNVTYGAFVIRQPDTGGTFTGNFGGVFDFIAGVAGGTYTGNNTALAGRMRVSGMSSGTIAELDAIRATNEFATSTGATCTDAHFFHADVDTTFDALTITNLYGLRLEGLDSHDNVTNLYGVSVESDTTGLWLGLGKDAHLYYDGTNLRINPKEVGSGYIQIDGQVLSTDKIMFTQTDGNEYIDSGADGYMDYGTTTAHRFNMAAADTDVRLEFIGTTNSGLLEWMEDEDYFKFSDEILMDSAEKINFRDTAIGIYSQADTYLDVFADGGVRIGDSSAGAPTNYAQFAPDGELTLVGTARVKKLISVSPGDLALGSTSPTYATIGNFRVMQFSNVTTQTVHYVMNIPNDWASGTDINVQLHWAPVDGNAGDVVWDLDWSSVASESNEVISGAGTNATVTDSTQSLQDELLEAPSFTISGASLAENDVLGMAISRDTGDAADTYGAAASLVEIHIEYTSNKLGTAT